MADQYATSFGVLNYSGLIFNTSDVATPILNMLPREDTQSVEFVIETRYALGDAAQPAISEFQSLVAPDAAIITRSQSTNVTQIFMKATAVSYAKLSNTNTLAGINVGGQSNNVTNELDWQIAAKTQEMRNDIEYTLINGTYQKATTDYEANKTRGFLEAIRTNIMDLAGSTLTHDDIVSMMQSIYTVNAPVQGLVMVVSPAMKRVITSIYPKESGWILPATRTMGGVSIDEILTDFGTIGVMIHNRMPNDTIMFANFGVAKIKEQPTPGKGNFFWEELAQIGAGIKGELFGQLGLDYGPEWYHGKITNIGGVTKYTIDTKIKPVLNPIESQPPVELGESAATVVKPNIDANITSMKNRNR